MSVSPKPSIRVVGDATVDWRIAVPNGAAPADLAAAYQWGAFESAGLAAEAGGAALVALLLQHAARGEFTVSGPHIPSEVLANPNSASLTQTFGVWQLHPGGHGQRDAAWRLQRYIGTRLHAPESTIPDPGNQHGPADCLVIDDAGLGFRDRPGEWSSILGTSLGTTRQIIVKLAGSLGDTPLWNHVLIGDSHAVTVYVAVGDLRKGYAAVGLAHSWERSANEIVRAVRTHPLMGRVGRTVVSLGLSGAVVIERDGDATLVFDPLHQEGDWERKRAGMASGTGTCIAASLALEATRNPADPDWPKAVLAGLVAGRAVHDAGYERKNGDGALAFPIELACGCLDADSSPDETFSITQIENEADWRLLPTSDRALLHQRASQVVLVGEAKACRGVPLERIGAWTSVDRTEIESLRSVRHIVQQFLAQAQPPRPLSLAVFGPPGSGKSFAVKQMAKAWASEGRKIRILEFNVAQFEGVKDLVSAMHRVRDAVVEQVVPLVFWDEFDSTNDGRELGWLARFLAPMQDGVFFEDGVARPIGPAIFVFAGGTHSTFSSFKDRAVSVPGAKATDFLSRLRGHVDVLGPNPRDADDLACVLRRAFLLRAQISSRAPHLAPGGMVSIDPGVLRAFLGVPAYLHGARSLEAIIEMSSLSERLRFERSALPARHQLALHVDANMFLDLVEGDSSR